MKTADAVIIGGGIMGASAAHFLAKNRFGKIVLLEAKHLAAVSTGHSAANVRTYYTNHITLELAKRALHMFEDEHDELGGDCGFQQVGFLLLVDPNSLSVGNRIFELESRHGLDVQDLSPDDIRELAPQLSLANVVKGVFEPRSGYADPVKTTQSLIRRAEEWGLKACQGSAATGIRKKAGRITGVETTDGAIETPVVINSAGAWAGHIDSWLDVKTSLRWSRESDLFVEMPADFGPLPVVSDPYHRSYFRPHSQNRIMAGLGAPKEIEPLHPNDYDPNLDPRTRQRIEEPLFKRVPALETAKHLGGYASIYTITDDWHPIVGARPEVQGYFAFFGGSGHGFKLAPPIGEALASIICGESPAIDIKAFRPERFIEGEPITSAWGEGNRG